MSSTRRLNELILQVFMMSVYIFLFISFYFQFEKKGKIVQPPVYYLNSNMVFSSPYCSQKCGIHLQNWRDKLGYGDQQLTMLWCLTIPNALRSRHQSRHEQQACTHLIADNRILCVICGEMMHIGVLGAIQTEPAMVHLYVINFIYLKEGLTFILKYLHTTTTTTCNFKSNSRSRDQDPNST